MDAGQIVVATAVAYAALYVVWRVVEANTTKFQRHNAAGAAYGTMVIIILLGIVLNLLGFPGSPSTD